MCKITATEFRRNINKYIALSKKEDVLETSYGKPLTLLTKPKNNKYDEFLDLCGLIKDYDYEKVLDERDSNR